MNEIVQSVQQACKALFRIDVDPILTRPEEKFGDYSTNIALQISRQVGKNPRELADVIAGYLRDQKSDVVQNVTVAGPGFINITLGDAAVLHAAAEATQKPQLHADKVIVTEYSDMNPFKQAHVGHLYTTIVGDVISRLYQASGATVHRVNFGGDVGLHVARTMWGITQFLGGEKPEGLQAVSANPSDQVAWLSARYVEGNRAYESSESTKQEIIAINQRVYQVHDQADHSSPFAIIYWTCRDWSYAYFKQFYDELQVSQFEKYYPESLTAPEGVSTVKEQLGKGVYELSDGAIVFDGEKYGLHTRVFINSKGLPTYEAKDVGLSMQKWRDYHFDKSVIITGSDITEYMKVVVKSIEQFEPELANRTLHLTHGNVKLAGGVKMSSRLGNGLAPEDVLQSARKANRQATGKDDENAVLAAVKHAFLRSRIGADIIYDPAESVSIHGNSGPYLQYAYARARSVLRKAGATPVNPESLEADERTLARSISQYPEAVAQATGEHMPHYICTYLYELAQTFNRFYEHNRVIEDPREAQRLQLITWYADVLKDGLGLLGIVAPEQM